MATATLVDMTQNTSQPLVQFIDLGPDAIAAETTLQATAEEVYALVANPARHAELDGGTTVRGLNRGVDGEFAEGDTFSQKMFMFIPYTLPMKVTRAEKNRGVTWLHPGKHTWSWDITDHQNGTVTVRETFDARDAYVWGFPMAKFYHFNGSFALNKKNIALSLANLHRLFSR